MPRFRVDSLITAIWVMRLPPGRVGLAGLPRGRSFVRYVESGVTSELLRRRCLSQWAVLEKRHSWLLLLSGQLVAPTTRTLAVEFRQRQASSIGSELTVEALCGEREWTDWCPQSAISETMTSDPLVHCCIAI